MDNRIEELNRVYNRWSSSIYPNTSFDSMKPYGLIQHLAIPTEILNVRIGELECKEAIRDKKILEVERDLVTGCMELENAYSTLKADIEDELHHIRTIMSAKLQDVITSDQDTRKQLDEIKLNDRATRDQLDELKQNKTDGVKPNDPEIQDRLKQVESLVTRLINTQEKTRQRNEIIVQDLKKELEDTKAIDKETREKSDKTRDMLTNHILFQDKVVSELRSQIAGVKANNIGTIRKTADSYSYGVEDDQSALKKELEEVKSSLKDTRDIVVQIARKNKENTDVIHGNIVAIQNGLTATQTVVQQNVETTQKTVSELREDHLILQKELREEVDTFRLMLKLMTDKLYHLEEEHRLLQEKFVDSDKHKPALVALGSNSWDRWSPPPSPRTNARQESLCRRICTMTPEPEEESDDNIETVPLPSSTKESKDSKLRGLSTSTEHIIQEEKTEEKSQETQESEPEEEYGEEKKKEESDEEFTVL